MLQSCGKSRVLQPDSEKCGISAPGKSPLRNFQPKSKLSRILGATGWGMDCARLAPMNEGVETTTAVLTAPLSSCRRFSELCSTPSSFIGGFLESACTY